MTACDFPGCTRPAISYGLCASHRRQADRGQPLKPLPSGRHVPLPDDPDERAIHLARTSHATPPVVRALLRGMGASRGWAPKVDGELLDVVTEEARCAGVEDATEARYQSDADPHRARCIVCPVRDLCLWLGRESHGWGIYGGVVLVDGYIAADNPAKERSRSHVETDPRPAVTVGA